jgi:hypothetical protein
VKVSSLAAVIGFVVAITAGPDATQAGAHGNHHETGPTPVRTWNELALDTVRIKRLSDVQAARLYAMVNVAIYDAVNGIVSSHGGPARDRAPALVTYVGKNPRGNVYAAASAGAHAVLVVEFPDQAPRYDQQLQSDLASYNGNVQGGKAWGAEVGAQVRVARDNDGSTPNETQQPGSGPGQLNDFRQRYTSIQT